MMYVMIASLVMNYLCIASIVLAVTCDSTDTDWVQVALMWPITVPMMWIRALRRRKH